MQVPDTNWHDVALDEGVLRNLENYTSTNQKQLAQLASSCDECHAGETPEFIASQIGFAAYSKCSDKNLETPVDYDTTGKEGRMMAFGYVGAKALSAADDGK
jgi:hypothetical protein